MRVTVERAGNTVGSPSGVRHGSLRDEHFVHVDLWGLTIGFRTGVRVGDTFRNVFSEGSDFTDFLEKDNRSIGRVSIDSDTCRVGKGRCIAGRMWSKVELDRREKMRQHSYSPSMKKKWSTHRHYRIHGTLVEPAHCTRLHRHTFGPSQRGKSSNRRFLAYSVEVRCNGWELLTTHSERGILRRKGIRDLVEGVVLYDESLRERSRCFE